MISWMDWNADLVFPQSTVAQHWQRGILPYIYDSGSNPDSPAYPQLCGVSYGTVAADLIRYIEQAQQGQVMPL